jgi:mannose-6-phosphate isomerase-like protein (cupin superfamily)
MFRFFCLCLFCVSLKGYAQTRVSLDTLKAPLEYNDVYVQKVYTSKNQTSFVIWIKTKVKKHKHLNHTELIHVLDGVGNMTMGKEIFIIKKGDFIVVPENTEHGVIVTSSQPLKVVSIQTPEFDGTDRIWVEDQ